MWSVKDDVSIFASLGQLRESLKVQRLKKRIRWVNGRLQREGAH